MAFLAEASKTTGEGSNALELEPWQIAREAFPELTKREAQVLVYLAQGLQNKKIAKKLKNEHAVGEDDVTEVMVKVNVKSVIRKLRAIDPRIDNRNKAALFAASRGVPSFPMTVD